MKRGIIISEIENVIFYLSRYRRQMRSLSTFNFLATAFFSSSTESRLFTVSVKGPPVKGATVTEIKFVGVFNKLFRCWFAATMLDGVAVHLLFVVIT